jgi:hypothetical protein
MKSVIVISPDRPDLRRMLEAYRSVGATNLQSPKRFTVEGDWGWFAVALDDELEDEFSEAEQTRIAQIITEPTYIQLEYSSSAAVDLAIKLMPTTAQTLIDNDHGMIRPIGEIRDLIHAGVEWQTSGAG